MILRLPRTLWIVLSLALLLRLGWGLTRPNTDAAIDALPDQREYLLIARNISEGRGAQFFDPRFEQTVFAYRLPGYPWFIAACACEPPLVRIVQALLGTSTVLAVFVLARRVVQVEDAADGPALTAAFLVAINPFLIYFSGLLLSETLFTTMLAWGMVLLVGGRSPSSLHWISGMLVLALSIYVRPSAIFLPIIFAVGATGLAHGFKTKLSRRSLFIACFRTSKSVPPLPVLRERAGVRVIWSLAKAVLHTKSPSPQPSPGVPGEGVVKRALNRSFNATGARRSVAAGALIVALLLPWAWRNSRPSVLGHWIWTTTNGGITAYDGWNPAAGGGSDQAFVSRMPELRTMGEIERSSYLTGLARDYVVNHPQRAIKLALRKLGRLWSPMPLSDQYSLPAYRGAALLYSIPFDLLVLAGLIRGKAPASAKVYLLLPAIYLTVVHMALVGSLRYLLPAIPSMSVLAGSVGHTMRLNGLARVRARASATPPSGQPLNDHSGRMG